MNVPRSLPALLLVLVSLCALPVRAAYPVLSTVTVAGSGGGADAAYGLAQDASGNLYAAGSLTQAGGLDIWVAKYSPALVLLSSYTYDKAGFDDAAWAVGVDTASGNVFAAGYVSSTAGFSGQDAWIAKFDSNLTVLSSVTVNGAGDGFDEAKGLRLHGGSLYVVGQSSTAAGRALWAARYDANLVLVASTTFVQWDPYGFDIQPVASGNVFVSGARAPNASTSVDAWIGKYDSNLVLLASSTINGSASNNDEFRRLADDGAGGVYAVGYLNTATAADRFIQHYDSNLVRVSSTLANGPGNSNEYLTDARLTSSGTVLVSGDHSEAAGAGGINAFIAEYSPGLTLLSSTSYRSAASGADHAYSTLIGANQDLYVAGWVAEATQDAWLARFSTSTPPSAPSGLASSLVGLGAATLSWASGGNPAGTVYELERSTGAGFSLRASTPGLSFIDIPLSPATTYYYRARARDAEFVYSAYTSTIAVVTPPVPVYPAPASVAPSSGAAGTSVPAMIEGSGFAAPAVLSLERADAVGGTWAATGSFAQGRFENSLTTLRDGRVLMAGGQLAGLTTGWAYADLYDPATGVWTAVPPLNQGRYAHDAVMLADGRVLVTGGIANVTIASAEIYDPAVNAWTTAAPMSVPRHGPHLALLADGRVLAAGGSSGVDVLSSAEIYDPAANSWSPANSMNEQRNYAAISRLNNGKVLVAGGWASATAEVYDPGTNAWTAAGTMSAARQGLHSVVLGNGKVLVAGGVNGAGAMAATDVYDPESNTWTTASPMAAARRGFALVTVNATPLAIAGETVSTSLASTEIFDAETNSWRPGPSLVGTRSYPRTVVLGDGRILAAGALRTPGNTNLNTAELLSMPTSQILATGVAVTNAQSMSGTFDLTGAATGYWDVVVAGPAGRTGRLSGGFLAVYPPSTPTALGASGVGLGAATLSWGANGNPAGTVYELERSTGPGFGLRKSTTATVFVDAALTAASTYYYRVRALNAVLAASAYSSSITVVTLPAPVHPAVASVTPSSGAVGTSVAAGVTGTGFAAPAVLSLQRTAVDQGSWTATGSFVQGRFDSTLTRLYDGRLLLAGGKLEGSSNGLTTVDLYDPATGLWTAGPPLRLGRSLAVAATLPDGRVLVAGGWGPTGAAVGSVEIYDPMLSTWTWAASLTAARMAHQLATLADGRVLAVGGWDGVNSLSSAEIYDPSLDSWSAAASMGEVRVYPAIALLGSGKVLLAGGSESATAEVYDPGANSWAAAGTMSVARQGLQTVSLPGGKVLVAGGTGPAGTAAAGDVYDPATNAWTATTPLAQARRGHAMATVNGAPMVIGGENVSTDFATTEIYDAATNAWRAGPVLAGTRTWPQASALDDGRLVVAGGRRGLAGGTNLSSAELLSAPTAQILATGVAVADAQSLSGTWNLTGAATGYWDVVVAGPDGRTGRLSGGFLAVSPPSTPTSLSSSLVGLGAATLGWASGGNPAGTVYELERSTGAGFGLRQSTTSLGFVDAALTAASTYYYRVRALNAVLDVSAYSSTIAVVTLPVPAYPAPVSVTPSSGAIGSSVPAAIAGSGFDGSAALSLEKRFVDQGVWTATGSFTQARFQGALIRLRDGRVLLAGGRLSSTLNGLANTDLFDPATGAWTAGPPLNQARAQHASVMLADGRVLISGGVMGAGIASCEIYDPALSTWTAVAPMAQFRHGHRLALLPDGRVLAAGGWDGAGPRSSAEIYDPATDSWTAAPAMSAARFYAAAATLSGGRILMAGGSGVDTAELYDPAANAWTAAGTMSTVRHLHELAVLPDGKVLVSGGAATGGTTNKADVYDPATNSWTATGPMALARYTHAMASINGTPLVVGGEDQSTAFGSTEIYDVAANTWRPGPSLTATRTWPQVVVLDDGQVLATGGLSSIGGANLNTAEVLAMPSSQVAATGVSVTDAQNMSGTFDLTGAATGYWDIVVRQSGDRVGRLAGGFLAVSTPAAPAGFSGAAASASSILWTWTDASDDETGFRVMSGAVNLSGDLPAGVTTWLQTGLAANFPSGPLSVRSFNIAGAGQSSTATRTTLAALPSSLAASGTSASSATVSWSAGGNPAGTVFHLERSTGAGFGLQFAGAATYYYDGSLAPATTYYYRARALNAESVATAYSSTLALVALPVPDLPAVPGAPAGAALGVSSVTWTWSLAAGATSHNLHRAATNAFLAAASSTSFAETGLTPNTAYGLRTAGVNLAGAGPLSAAATAYTLAAAPSGTGVAVTSTTIVASWGLNGNPAATVAELLRSTDAVAYSTLAVAAVASYAEADLLGCTTYYYRVRNVNGDGLPTVYASFQGVTANTVPSPPAGLAASANAGGTVSLLWSLSPTEGVTGYRLYWDAGTGTVSYAAPIAVLGSTATAFTTGVLTSSSTYTFALRAAHRCGVVETTGASAMSGAAAALPAVRAAIKEPDSGRRINGNRVTILGELISGTPSDAQQVLFQYKQESSSAWLDVPAANVNHSNPDLAFPYFVHWDVTALAAGPYDLRAVAYDLAGVPDSSPPAVRVVVDPVTPDIRETLTVEGKIKKDQTVSNAVISVVETAGAGAGDPAVRVTLPPGVVNTTSATLTVIANPTITTAAPAGQSMVGSAIKISLSNGQTALTGTAAIVMTYPDTVRFPSLLQIYYLDEATGAWSRDFATTVDAASRTVTGHTPHFSTFVLMLGTAFAANLDSVQVYPVPFKPNGTNPDEGRPFTHGDANSGIIFANLASASEIKIYTLSGRLVSRLDSPSIAGAVRWDARNQDGRDVASGAYFAVITAPGQKSVVKKLVIIR